tara:strand:+ start:981 stop:2297 length:1317 start_codon:yes stop_codon:yes gene_type:complete
MRSLRIRLLVGLTIIITILLVGQWLWLTLTIDRFIEKQVITQLQKETESILANIAIDHKSNIQLDQQPLNSGYQRAFSGLYFIVQTQHKTLLSRSLWDFDLVIPTLKKGEQKIMYLAGPQKQPLLAVSAAYLKQGKLITIAVAEDASSMLADKRQIQYVFTALSAMGLLLLVFIQAWLVKQALQPLTNAQSQLKQLEQGQIDRINNSAPDEIKPLLNELNRLTFSMLEKSRRSRQSIGNLAHRLKTPLAVLNQVAESDTFHDENTSRGTILQQTAKIKQIIDRELKRARLSGVTMLGKGINLEDLINQLVETLRLIYQDKAISIDWHISKDVNFKGDREDMLEVLGNLLDNACKWCDSQVQLRLEMEDGLVITVEDDGPSCDIDDLSLLTRRGFRADESRPGSGLGLAIVFDIVDSYDGSMAFYNSEKMGGLQVKIYL